jgi:hypothetical protein
VTAFNRAVIASEAKQSSATPEALDGFVASLLALTVLARQDGA